MSLEIPLLEPCPFCAYLAGHEPCAFVRRGEVVSSFLNRTQYERGALLIASNVHVDSVLHADERLTAETYREAHRLAQILVGTFNATGVNIFQNNGIAAGQTVPHYHVHVVPRYPASDPARRFRESDFEQTPIDELHALATLLQASQHPHLIGSA